MSIHTSNLKPYESESSMEVMYKESWEYGMLRGYLEISVLEARRKGKCSATMRARVVGGVSVMQFPKLFVSLQLGCGRDDENIKLVLGQFMGKHP